MCEITKIPAPSSKGNLFPRMINLDNNAVVFPLPGTAYKSKVVKFFIKSRLSLSNDKPLGSKSFSVSSISLSVISICIQIL